MAEYPNFYELTHMTYYFAMHLAYGLVFISDSLNNAGIDQISTFRKLFFSRILGSG